MTGRYMAASVSCPVACTVKARRSPYSVPVGMFTFAERTACSTWSMPMPRLARARGSNCTRTAYFCEPKTCTWATPLTIEMRCAISVSPYSSSVHNGSVAEVRPRYMIG